MYILGIETSCDETSAAIIQAEKNNQSVNVLANSISSSLLLHSRTGGIIPEVAARQQIKYILPVIQEALSKSSLLISRIDAIAVTYGPGLIGSLLVGIETAKTLSYVWNKPIVPINHLIGHIYANWIKNSQFSTFNSQLGIEFPALALVVSGGHTDLVLILRHGSFQWLGGTRDDAAGEALDKIGRLIGFPYPAGSTIEKAAKEGNPKRFLFPRPMIYSKDLDFSFSGLKTSAMREVSHFKKGALKKKDIADISAGVQEAIIDVLVTKTLKAAKQYNVKSILLGGGVAANQKLREELQLSAKRYQLNAKIFAPQKSLCTDNAAMIATAAFFNYQPCALEKITANPEVLFA